MAIKMKLKRTTLTLLLICMASALMSHDMRMAHYFVYVEDEKVYCDAKIDLEDLEKALASEADQQNISSFLAKNLSFHFDGKDVRAELLTFERNRNWVEFKLALNTANTTPIQVEIFNSVLSEEIAGHDNLMRFIFHGHKRIFRLNKNRQQISFSYKRS